VTLWPQLLGALCTCASVPQQLKSASYAIVLDVLRAKLHTCLMHQTLPVSMRAKLLFMQHCFRSLNKKAQATPGALHEHFAHRVNANIGKASA